jgi:hypothetical protein
MTFGSTFGRTFSPTFQPKSQAGGIVGGTVTVGAAADTYIPNQNTYTRNFGATTALLGGGAAARKILYRFNLSSIPAAATCTAAKLTLTSSGTSWGGAGRWFYVYGISDANGDWVEGTANGTDETGSPCWYYKAYHPSTPTDWAGSDGLSTAGTDYVDTVIASYEITSSKTDGQSYDVTFNAAGLTVVKSWFGQSTNNGFFLYNTTINFAVYAKEYSTESYRPTLTVTYS